MNKKNNRKIFLLVSIVILSIILISCNNDTSKEKNNLNNLSKNEVLVTYDELSDPDEDFSYEFAYDFLSYKDKDLNEDNLLNILNNVPINDVLLFLKEVQLNNDVVEITLDYVDETDNNTAKLSYETLDYLDKSSVLIYYLFPSINNISFTIMSGPDVYNSLNIDKDYIQNKYKKNIENFTNNESIYYFLKYKA